MFQTALQCSRRPGVGDVAKVSIVSSFWVALLENFVLFVVMKVFFVAHRRTTILFSFAFGLPLPEVSWHALSAGWQWQ